MEKLLSIAEVSQILGVHDKTVRALVRNRAIAFSRVGNQYRFRPKAIDDYLKLCERPAMTPGSAHGRPAA
jgi:excisionase family DNA binding protein